LALDCDDQMSSLFQMIGFDSDCQAYARAVDSIGCEDIDGAPSEAQISACTSNNRCLYDSDNQSCRPKMSQENLNVQCSGKCIPKLIALVAEVEQCPEPDSTAQLLGVAWNFMCDQRKPGEFCYPLLQNPETQEPTPMGELVYTTPLLVSYGLAGNLSFANCSLLASSGCCSPSWLSFLEVLGLGNVTVTEEYYTAQCGFEVSGGCPNPFETQYYLAGVVAFPALSVAAYGEFQDELNIAAYEDVANYLSIAPGKLQVDTFFDSDGIGLDVAFSTLADNQAAADSLSTLAKAMTTTDFPLVLAVIKDKLVAKQVADGTIANSGDANATLIDELGLGDLGTITVSADPTSAKLSDTQVIVGGDSGSDSGSDSGNGNDGTSGSASVMISMAAAAMALLF